eukprot:TRINITY_DN2050_c0_g1_i2.p1 TRINITY_DN2050_c0_g1~~TRINITY_DN2050_c0_g1_i2.p1  ORF type:complete len:286 (+),score=60.07 TRINITY_DN2050_c0_g1_i2:104-859(+)
MCLCTWCSKLWSCWAFVALLISISLPWYTPYAASSNQVADRSVMMYWWTMTSFKGGCPDDFLINFNTNTSRITNSTTPTPSLSPTSATPTTRRVLKTSDIFFCQGGNWRDKCGDCKKLERTFDISFSFLFVALLSALLLSLTYTLGGYCCVLGQPFYICGLMLSVLEFLLTFGAFLSFLAVNDAFILDKGKQWCKDLSGGEDVFCESFSGSSPFYWSPGPGWIACIISLVFISISISFNILDCRSKVLGAL